MQRYLNLLRVFAGYLLSRISRKVFHWGYPVSISIEPTNRCNLRCPECPSGALELTRPRGVMSLDTFRVIIRELKDHLFYLILYFQGEPLMNRHFFEMVRDARENDLYVITSTNGHFLTTDNVSQIIRSGLDEIIISVDGITQESYEQYRHGGKLETVVAGIRELAAQRKQLAAATPRIIVQFIVFRFNQDQISQIRKLGKEWGADEVQIKSAQIYNFEHGHPFIPELTKYSRYKKLDNHRYAIKNPLRDYCWRAWSTAVFTWEGDVVPCCYDKDATHKMGNILDTSFAKIWKNGKYTGFRKRILTSRKSVDICRNCDQKW